MKIAHIVSTYPPYYGGMGNVAFQTASALAARGHEVEVFTPLFADIPDQDEVAFARRLQPSFSFGNAARIPQIAHVLDDADIVHLHYPFFGTANLVRRWKKKHPDKAFVLTYHMDPRAPSWKGVVFKLYAKFWMPKIIAAADHCIVSSFEYLEASDAAHVYKKNKEKWSEIPFGVDTERFYPAQKSAELFDQYALNVNLPTVIFVGGMDAAHQFKGIPVLLEAISSLRMQDIYVQCVLVGEGELRSQYEQFAHQLGIDDRVRFVGSISNEALPVHYQMADLCVLPSIAKNEAFGMVLLEAYASGVPVLASDLPGVRSVAMKAGTVVKPKHATDLAVAISEYIAGVDVARARLRARAVAEELYQWDVIVEQLEGVYNKGITH